MSKGRTKNASRTNPRNPYARRKPGTTELLVWGVPQILKERFHARCVKTKKSMKDAVIKFMEDFVGTA